MTDEKNDLVSVTIRVDPAKGVQLAHTCAKCGTVAHSKPTCFESFDRETGQVGEVFTVRNAMRPEGWEHLRITDPEKTWHLEVCPKCIREFFGVKS